MQPIQPIVDGRFKENSIVRYILDNGGIDLNIIATKQFSTEDREQFAQLIGYSLNGFSELSYVTDETLQAAEKINNGENDWMLAKIKSLEEKLENLKEELKEPIAKFYGIHPDDLTDRY